ncbi:hypothetical protein PY95_00555 [Lacticaseibacillus rhamnosus]|nr:hypothetical protein PY95_00555 [Lacticaseibacillus rhamnosus]OAU07424.1 hypothetical protein PY72_00555 [Lacticaseibacillus rhamnosus]
MNSQFKKSPNNTITNEPHLAYNCFALALKMLRLIHTKVRKTKDGLLHFLQKLRIKRLYFKSGYFKKGIVLNGTVTFTESLLLSCTKNNPLKRSSNDSSEGYFFQRYF